MPKSLESLPRELRQHIFNLAFDDAAAQDHRLNELIRTCIRRQDGLVRLEYDCVPAWKKVLGDECCEWPIVHAPHISELATSLRATYPDFIDDVTYVLERILNDFDEEQDMTVARSEESIMEGISDMNEAYLAIEESGKRAKARGERFDCCKETGNNRGIQALVMIMEVRTGEDDVGGEWEYWDWDYLGESH